MSEIKNEMLENFINKLYERCWNAEQHLLISIYIKQLLLYFYRDCFEESIKLIYFNYVVVRLNHRRRGETTVRIDVLCKLLQYVKNIKLLVLTFGKRFRNFYNKLLYDYFRKVGINIKRNPETIIVELENSVQSLKLFYRKYDEDISKYKNYDLVIVEGPQYCEEDYNILCRNNLSVIIFYARPGVLLESVINV